MLKGWKGKLLSRVGKEVLLKFIIQAKLTYLVGIFKLQGGLIDDICNLYARFLVIGAECSLKDRKINLCKTN